MNLAKSEVVPMGDVTNVESMTLILGCKISHLPMQYLGLLLGSTFN